MFLRDSHIYIIRRTVMKKFLSILLSAVILLTGCADKVNTTPESVWDLVSEAYTYVFPLVMMNATKISSTNTETPAAGRAPVNQLIHSQKLADAESKMVVTPNVDTIYTQAWLDLSEEPMIFVMPEADRFFKVQVLDAWTNTAAVLEKAGIYAFTRTDWKGELPDGVIRVDVPTSTVWLIARILLSGQDDLPNVYAIQNEMRLFPLSAYYMSTDYAAPKGTYTAENDFVPVDKVLSMDPKTFFDTANKLMQTNPPAAEDSEILNAIKAINVGPGMEFNTSVLDGDISARWKEMLENQRNTLLADTEKYCVKLGQWQYFDEPIGNFGTEYNYRALVALAGLGANTVDVAIYPKTDVDSTGAKLTGENSYVMHFDTMPPLLEGGFWSVTAYGSDDFLIDNPIDRYCLNDRSDFKLNGDGSLDIILSKEQPADASNWLPVSDDEFHLYMRIYTPDMAALKSWQPPVVERSGDIKSDLGLTAEQKPASEYTAKLNADVYSELDFSDKREAEFAVRGLIDAPEKLVLTDENGGIIWSQEAYSFIDEYEQAPDTVNPSLWENTKNNHAYGLFEVCEGIYQVRGYDMANLTVIKGDTGWIVFDPLMSSECTRAAMQLIEKNLGSYPVKAVIISHPHVDHFGGILGAMSAEDAADGSLSLDRQLASGKIPIIVPEGFAEHAIAENVYAGKAMGRRANYQYGVLLEPGVSGKLAMGIGMGQSTGTVTYLAPTYEVKETGEKIIIDGVEMEFQLTPGTEAPAEMNTWFPQYKALWVAENCTGTLHNLYTLRGAQVRDGAAWASYITEAITRYGKDVEITFQSHNWPHWDNETVNEYLVNTAAVYKFINDQTLTYINQGYTSDEISNMIKLPDALEKVWYTRQYYGTVAHDSKAVYQKYMGWYDANPVHLDPLMPTESAKKWVEYLGDVDEVLRMAKKDYENGEYQWVAEITNTIVFADPDNTDARLLCADALEQLGYQAESGTWRNAYLTAALELRNGNSAQEAPQAKNNGAMIREMTAQMMFDYMAILLNKQALAEYDFTVNVTLTDTNEKYMLRIKNGVLLTYNDTLSDAADLSVTCPKNALFLIISNDKDNIAKAIKADGDTTLLTLLADNMNEIPMEGISPFNIVEP